MARRPRVSAALRRQVTARDGQRCAYCRSPLVVGIPMVVEHIVPLAAGGASMADNLCLSCYRCNEFKGPRQQAAIRATASSRPCSTRGGSAGATTSPGPTTA